MLMGNVIGGIHGIDAFTKIMLHFDGTNGSTTITDSAPGTPHSWTANGNAQLDTGITKFGTATLLCDGTGDYVTTPDSADFTLGSGDWTVDFWFNRAGGDGLVRNSFGQINATADNVSTSIIGSLRATNTIRGVANVGSTIFAINGTTAITTPGWHHYVFVRTGNILRLFLDGIQEGGDLAITGSINDSANAWSVGRRGEQVAESFNGSIDEFRLSVGIARWTANFTPPTGPYTI